MDLDLTIWNKKINDSQIETNSIHKILGNWFSNQNASSILQEFCFHLKSLIRICCQLPIQMRYHWNYSRIPLGKRRCQLKYARILEEFSTETHLASIIVKMFLPSDNNVCIHIYRNFHFYIIITKTRICFWI